MSGSTPMGGELMGCQFSVYPLVQDSIDEPIQDAIEAAARAGAAVRVQNLSTLIQGDEETVFRAVREAFRAARTHGRTVLLATFTTGVPHDETVAEIQEHRVGGSEQA